jgi:hypothetical protein
VTSLAIVMLASPIDQNATKAVNITKTSTSYMYDIFTELGPLLFIEMILIMIIIKFEVNEPSVEMKMDGKASRYRRDIREGEIEKINSYL